MRAGRGRSRRAEVEGAGQRAGDRGAAAGAASTCCCELERGETLVMHLRMTGNLLLVERDRSASRGRRRPLPAGPLRSTTGASCWFTRRAPLRRGVPGRDGGARGPLRGPARDRAALGAVHRRGAGGAGGRAPGAAEVVPARPGGDRRGRQHLRRRGALPGPASPALAGRLDARRARGGAARGGDRRRCEAGLDGGGASIDDYRDARGERGIDAGRVPRPHAARAKPCPRCGEADPADRRRRALDLLLPRLPGAAAAAAAAPAPPDAARGVAEIARPGGFAIGHWTDRGAQTGCTVVIPPPGSRCGVDVRGGGPGTRETDVIGPLAGAHEASAVAALRRQRLRARGRRRRRPLARGAGPGTRDSGRDRPDRPRGGRLRPRRGRPVRAAGPEQGYAACEAARGGSAGAGPGRRRQRRRGRQDPRPRARRQRPGSATRPPRTGSGETVAALAVVNAFGDVLGEDGSVLAGPAGRGRRDALHAPS